MCLTKKGVSMEFSEFSSCSANVLGEWLNCTPQQIRQLAEVGILTDKYDFVESVQNYIRYLRNLPPDYKGDFYPDSNEKLAEVIGRLAKMISVEP